MKFPAGFSTIIHALRTPNFGIYTAGHSVSLVGLWMHRVATGWLTWELTRSGTWLGLIAMAELFPMVIVGPFAGAAADRWNRLAVTKVTQGLILIIAGMLSVLAATGHITIGLLFALTAALGIVESFNHPARQALIPSLVQRADLASAVAINSITFNFARFLGPALAGFVLVAAGAFAVFAASAACSAVFLLALARIRLAAPDKPALARASFLSDLQEGFRYSMTHPGLSAIFILMIVTTMAGRPFLELLPGFAAEVFASGPSGLAAMTSTVGAGAILAGFWLGARQGNTGLTRIVLAYSLVLAAAVLIFAATDRVWIALPALGLAGFSMSATGISLQTLIHLAANPFMRGRVLSIHGLIFRGGPALGALLMGWLSERFGLRLPVFLGALLVIAAWFWAHLRRHRIARALER